MPRRYHRPRRTVALWDFLKSHPPIERIPIAIGYGLAKLGLFQNVKLIIPDDPRLTEIPCEYCHHKPAREISFVDNTRNYCWDCWPQVENIPIPRGHTAESAWYFILLHQMDKDNPPQHLHIEGYVPILVKNNRFIHEVQPDDTSLVGNVIPLRRGDLNK